MPASPCNRICCLNHSDVCLGCGRTLQEIKDWHVADRTQKLDILLPVSYTHLTLPTTPYV